MQDLNLKLDGAQPFDLLILYSRITTDPWFFQREMAVKKAWEAEHPELTPEAKQLAGVNYDFARTAAQAMTREEKAEFRARLGLRKA
jgi:hypothetical protein